MSLLFTTSPSNSQQIYPYLTGLPGTAKTHIGVRYGANIVSDGRPVVVSQPSKLLIDATVRELRKDAPKTRITVIHEDTHPGMVVSAAVRWFNTEPDGMLFITHECYDRIPYIESKKRLTVIVDEVPKLVRFFGRDMAHTHGLLTEYLNAKPVDEHYSILKVRDQDAVEQMVRRRHDQFWDEMKPLTAALISDKWDVYVETKQYQQLLQGDGDDTDDWYRLTAYAVRKPSSFAGFREVLFLGALFEETLLFHHWQRQAGVEFRPAEELQKQLRPPPNGKLIDIWPMVEGPWSKGMRDGKSVGDIELAFRDAARLIMGEEKYIWLPNVDRPEFFEDLNDRMPGSPYGHNHLQHYNNAVIAAALNPRPGQYRFLTSALMGNLMDKQVQIETMALPTLHAVLRTSARNPESRSYKRYLVQDIATAEAIARWLPGSRVHEPVLHLRINVGRPRKWESNAERDHARRSRTRGRPRKWENEAERHQAYRRRKS
jgi:hypothetical protein